MKILKLYWKYYAKFEANCEMITKSFRKNVPENLHKLVKNIKEFKKIERNVHKKKNYI